MLACIIVIIRAKMTQKMLIQMLMLKTKNCKRHLLLKYAVCVSKKLRFIKLRSKIIIE